MSHHGHEVAGGPSARRRLDVDARARHVVPPVWPAQRISGALLGGASKVLGDLPPATQRIRHLVEPVDDELAVGGEESAECLELTVVDVMCVASDGVTDAVLDQQNRLGIQRRGGSLGHDRCVANHSTARV